MNFEFLDKDDYEIIIPKDKQGGYSDFHALIDKHFPDEKNLIFCLLEVVTNDNITAIGERHIKSSDPIEKTSDILNKYEIIVKKVVSQFGISLSDYKEWYYNKTYILLKTNDVAYIFPHINPNWELDPNAIQVRTSRSNAGILSEEFLSKDHIQKYLQFYAELIHEELFFKKYPHYCIIIRPISVVEGENKIFPLGNLYLHFATMTQKDEGFYFRLINDMLIVWFQKKGGRVIKEIQNRSLTQQQSKSSRKKYLPNFQALRHPEAHKRLARKLKNSNFSLEDYYDHIFTNDELRESFCSKLNKLKKIVIPKFFHLKVYRPDVKDSVHLKFSDISEKLGYSDNIFGIQGQSCLKSKFNIGHFEKILIRREFFKIGLLLFDIDSDILRNILCNKGIGKFDFTQNADYTALWSEMFIPWAKPKKESHDSGETSVDTYLVEKSKALIISSLSDFEREYLAECKKYKSSLTTSSPDIE